MLERHAFLALCFAGLSLAFGCATNRDGRDRYDDDRTYRNGPYYGQPYPHGHGGHETPLERHQEREQRALEQQQQAEDRELRHEQRDERQELKQADQWDRDDRHEQHQEKRALEHGQKEEKEDLRDHQKQERKRYDD